MEASVSGVTTLLERLLDRGVSVEIMITELDVGDNGSRRMLH
jgi:hypothetical protein